jgi:MFS family permease
VFYGWYIAAAAFFTLLITVGVPFYGMPFFYDYFIRDFGWTRAQTTSGIALATILVQPVAGLLLHRYSTRRLILFGAGMLLVALAAFGLGNGSLLLYYFAWCAFMLGYIYSGPLPHQVLLTQWFRRNRGLAIGLSYLGLGLGGAISQKYVALPLIRAFGWRTALFVMAGSMLLLIPLLLFVVRDKPADSGLYPDGADAPPPENSALPHAFRELLRQRSFWLLAAGSCMSIGAIGSINQHMKLIFQDAGLSASTVADTTFWILITSLIGRVAIGWLADRYSKKLVMVAAYLLLAIPLPLLFVIHRPGIPLLFAIAFGFGLGACYMLIPLMAAQLFGPNSLARVMGIILPTDSIGQTCFPFLLGILRDHFGNYIGGLAVVIALAFGGALAVALLPGQPRGSARSPVIGAPVILAKKGQA